MDCSCNCFGIAASSKVPVKRYNLLVPDIFPRQPPEFNAPLDASILRKIKKLVEYVELNPHRAPKVSRRLARTVNKELRKPKHHGQVKLAVEAYIQLFLKLRTDDSALITREVILQPVSKTKPPSAILDGLTMPHFNSVVGVLLRFPKHEIKALGANLLTAFIQAQQDSEYVTTVDHFVPMLTNAVGQISPSQSEESVSGPIPQVSLATACLTALRQYIYFCKKMAFASPHLDDVQACLLDVVGKGAASGAILPPPLNGSSIMLASSTQGPSPESSVHASQDGPAPPERSPYEVAVQALQDLFLMTKDAADGRRVLQGCLHYMDRGQHWQEKDGVLRTSQRIMQSVFKEEQQRYMWYSSLIRHVSAPGLSPDQRSCVLATAREEGENLQDALASPALVLALKKLPEALPPEGAAGKEALLRDAILDSIRDWAGNVENSLYLVEAMGGVLVRLPQSTPACMATLDCLLAAAQAIPTFSPGGRVLPSKTFPDVQLREVMGVIANGEGPVRERGCRLLAALLPITPQGLTTLQAHAVFSALWYATGKPDGSPPVIIAMDSLLAAILGKCTPETLLEAAKLALSWPADVAAGPAGRLAALKQREKLGLLSLSSGLLARVFRAASPSNGLPATPAALPGSGLRVNSEGALILVEGPGAAIDAASGAAALAALPTTKEVQRKEAIGHLKGSRLFGGLGSAAGSGPSSPAGSGAAGLGESGVERCLAEAFTPRPLSALQPRASRPANGEPTQNEVAKGEIPRSLPQISQEAHKDRPLGRRRSSVDVEPRGLHMVDLKRMLVDEASTEKDTAGEGASFTEVAGRIANDEASFNPPSLPAAASKGNGGLGTRSTDPRSASAGALLGPAAILGSSQNVFNLVSKLDGPPQISVP